eukprot:scpid62798/ scgid19128/ S-type anion channel SLAH3; SLAC1-homolog protein 3
MFDLHRFPASAFGICLGTAGQSSLWHALSAQNVTTGPLGFLVSTPHRGLSMAFWMISLTLFALFTALYVIKAVYRWRAVVWEFKSSIHVNFFFMPFLIVMVMGVSAPTPPFETPNMPIALFYIVIVLLLCLELCVYTEWMYGVSRTLSWANPAYQLSIVGNIIGAGVAASLGDKSMSVFLFAIGILYQLMALVALHTTPDLRAWLGSGLHKQSAAETDRVRDGQRWIGSQRTLSRRTTAASLVCATSQISHPSHLQLRTTGEDAGSAVFNNRPVSADSSDLVIAASASSIDIQDTPSLPPLPQVYDDVESDGSTTDVERALDLLSVGEVHSKQLLPWSVNTWSLPASLQPTLFLYTAPPSLAAISWAHMQGGAFGKASCDEFCQSLASIGIFFFLVMVVHLPRFLFRTPFSLAFWAFTFPSSALAIAVVEFAVATNSMFMHGFASFLVFLSPTIYCIVLFVTVLQVSRKGFDVILLPAHVPR